MNSSDEEASLDEEAPVVVKEEQIEENSEVVKEVKQSKTPKQKAEPKTTETPEPSNEPPKPPICSVCNEEFDTRNKLFEHIKKEGHAVLKPTTGEQPTSHNAAKRNKRLLNKSNKNK